MVMLGAGVGVAPPLGELQNGPTRGDRLVQSWWPTVAGMMELSKAVE